MANENSTTLGDIGELISLEEINSWGKGLAVLSSNKYDSVKDILWYNIDYLSIWNVEVKTQPPFVTKNMLSIRKNQETKIMNSNLLMWITTPMEDYPRFKYGGCIFLTPKPKKLIVKEEYNKYFLNRQGVKESTRMIGYDIDQPAILFHKRIENPEYLELLIKYRSFNYD